MANKSLNKGKQVRKFDYKKIVKANTAVHCKTEEHANELLAWADSVGLRWIDGNSYLKYNNYSFHKENTCYDLYENSFTYIEYCKSTGYKIIPFKKALKKSKKTKIKNLHKALAKKDEKTIMKEISNKRGRPVEKPNRAKIGLSITQDASKTLNELAEMTGKTKSKIFEEAIKIMREREEIIYARMENYQKYGKDVFLDFEEYMKNRKASKRGAS